VTGFNKDDRVAFTLGYSNYTGTIVEPNDVGDDYIVETTAGTRFAVPAEDLVRMPIEQPADEDVLAVQLPADGATIMAIHDRTGRRFRVLCSDCGIPHTRTYTTGITDADRDQLRQDAIADVATHIDLRHTTTPDVATTGGQQP
jgi:hypothetical protein